MNELVNVVLVGFGRAGRIHAETCQRLSCCRLIAIVETSPDRRRLAAEAFSGVKVFESLKLALIETGNDVVVDLCVPAPQNIELCQTAIEHDVCRLMLEKPLGWQLSAAIELGEILRGRSAVYQDTYQFSKGVELLRKYVEGERSSVKDLRIRFLKNRKEDSGFARGFYLQSHPDAWHIEGPHMVAIAESVAGTIISIEEAHLYDMHADGKSLSGHGGGDATVRHHGGAQTTMSTDLRSKLNERAVDVFLENGVSFHLQLPRSKSSEQVSSIVRKCNGRAVASFSVEDRPMEQCVSACVEYFYSSIGNVPTISRGISINETLQKICAAAGYQVCNNEELCEALPI